MANKTIRRTLPSFSFWFGASVIVLMTSVALLSLVWTPYDVINTLNVAGRLQQLRRSATRWVPIIWVGMFCHRL